MADLTILLKYYEDDLHYSINEGKTYQVLKEETTFECDCGTKVVWQCADDSIRAITGFEINLDKGDSRFKFGKIWKTPPVVVKGTEEKCWSSETIPEVPKGEYYRNGWTIYYTTKDGVKREKDPGNTLPIGGPH